MAEGRIGTNPTRLFLKVTEIGSRRTVQYLQSVEERALAQHPITGDSGRRRTLVTKGLVVPRVDTLGTAFKVRTVPNSVGESCVARHSSNIILAGDNPCKRRVAFWKYHITQRGPYSICGRPKIGGCYEDLQKVIMCNFFVIFPVSFFANCISNRIACQI